MRAAMLLMGLVAVVFVAAGCGGGSATVKSPAEIGIDPMAGVQLPSEVARDADGRVVVQTPQIWTTFGFRGDVVTVVSNDRILDVERISGTQTYRVLPMLPGLASVTFTGDGEEVKIDVRSAPPTPTS